MIKFAHIISIGFAVFLLLWIIRIIKSTFILRKMRSTNTKAQNDIDFYILLPVLNENSRLREFVSYYLDSLLPSYENLHLVVITTEREKVLYSGSKTLDIAEQLAKKHNNISHLHVPNKSGAMAHQLNYAVNSLPDDSICVVYNADSRPEPQTFRWVSSRINIGVNQAFQQYGLYLKNVNFLSKQRIKHVLLANAYWQCRWSLGFEFYRAHAAHSRLTLPPSLRPFNYCIGHGIFITTNLIKSIKFSEATVNEDAILGLELARNNVILSPIPFFDIADSPDSVKSIFVQKSVWFQGPYQSMLYYKLLKGTKLSPALLLNSVKLFSHALYWVLGPFLAVVLSIVVVVSPENIVLVVSPIAFIILPTVITKIMFEHMIMPSSRQYSKQVHYMSLVLGSIPAYIIHGAAAIRGVILSSYMLRGNKPKTAMTQNGET